MERLTENKIVLVTRHTRLDDLVARFNTVSQAKFYVEHLGADDLIAFCKTRLTTYKVPRTIELRAELPISGAGKLLRRVLRESPTA